jgi:amino-acid N-acetyltransferase
VAIAHSIRRATQADRLVIPELLASAGLPIDDLHASTIDWLVAAHDGQLGGVVGLERYGQAALLRSLAVNDQIRGSGLGKRLVERMELHAHACGISQLVLLTQTAANFFSRLGYELVTREMVAEAIGNSAQFRSICPSSATCMCKYLSKVERN